MVKPYDRATEDLGNVVFLAASTCEFLTSASPRPSMSPPWD